jgi:hypothetical protein
LAKEADQRAPLRSRQGRCCGIDATHHKEKVIEQMLHAFDVREIDRGVYPVDFGIRF